MNRALQLSFPWQQHRAQPWQRAGDAFSLTADGNNTYPRKGPLKLEGGGGVGSGHLTPALPQHPIGHLPPPGLFPICKMGFTGTASPLG